MGQDIRNMLKEEKPEQSNLQDGHEMRFAKKLEQSFPKKEEKPTFLWLKVAAAIIVFLGLGYLTYLNFNEEEVAKPVLAQTEGVENATEQQFTLGDLSPDLKKIEDFYTTGIEVQLASFNNDDDNKELIDAYMKRLKELDVEYKKLNKELNEVGPTEATITALVDNLKLRLELLFKLKNKLKELKQLENEQFNENIV
jgi:hypothetical protein